MINLTTYHTTRVPRDKIECFGTLMEEPVRRQRLFSILHSAGALLAGCGSLLIAGIPSAHARITGLTNCTTTSPYGSTSFGTVGTYQQLACTANGAVDPNDPLNAMIQDIQLAPKVGGLVQYSMDLTNFDAHRPQQEQSCDAVRCSQSRQ
jgi:hypothetical protein